MSRLMETVRELAGQNGGAHNLIWGALALGLMLGAMVVIDTLLPPIAAGVCL